MVVNWKLLLKSMGMLLSFESMLFAVCIGVAIMYHEDSIPFLWAMAVSLAAGVVCRITGRNSGRSASRKDGYIIVSTVWVVFSIIGMIPFMVAGTFKDVASAFFETMSGFTSTGATVLPNIDSQPRSILFWRSVTQWIGGVGIIFFTIALLPAVGNGEVKVFAAETTGPLHDKIHPRISVATKWIATLYLTMTFACCGALWLCGMGLFDAINIAMTTTATGGFSPHSALMHEAYNIPGVNYIAIEYILVFFMFVCGTNFSLLYWVFFKRKLRNLTKDAEFKCYLLIVVAATIICTVILMIYNGNLTPESIESDFRDSIFTVVSLQTTTGFACCDYSIWPPVVIPVIMFIMFAGASSGSTSGGFKCIRLVIIYKVIKNEFTHILHPRAVLPIKVNKAVVPANVRQTLLALLALYLIFFFIGTIIMLCDSSVGTYYEAFSVSLASLCNIGPSEGRFGPTACWDILSPVSKWTCSVLMLLGRLEIFPILIVLSKSFWRKT